MTAGIIITDEPVSSASTTSAPEDPYLIEVVAPIESETKAATLAELRGNVPADRNTLAGLSDAIDQAAADIAADVRRISRRIALTLG